MCVSTCSFLHNLSLPGDCSNPLSLLQDATLAAQDYFDWTNIASFTRDAMALMLDTVKVQDHILVGKFLGHLIQINQMRKEDFNSGYVCLLQVFIVFVSGDFLSLRLLFCF